MVLNSTRIWRTRFSPTANDPWSRLRKGYTGPRLFVNLLLLVAFLLPYAAKCAGWRCVNKVEIAVTDCVSRLTTDMDSASLAREPRAYVLDKLASQLTARVPDEDNGWRRFAVWELLLGFDKKVTYWTTAIALVVYNLLRASLTVLVAPLRDEEERSGHCPEWIPEGGGQPGWRHELRVMIRDPIDWSMRLRLSYGWMVGPERVVRVLFWIAMGAMLLHLADWLGMEVLLPPRHVP
jgi:hypothetical protein